jgi:hypothetical protein
VASDQPSRLPVLGNTAWTLRRKCISLVFSMVETRRQEIILAFDWLHDLQEPNNKTTPGTCHACSLNSCRNKNIGG